MVKMNNKSLNKTIYNYIKSVYRACACAFGGVSNYFGGGFTPFNSSVVFVLISLSLIRKNSEQLKMFRMLILFWLCCCRLIGKL